MSKVVSAVGSKVDQILHKAETIAVVGVSEKPNRPSYGVAKHLQKYFTIIPINPNLESWEGLPCYPSLLQVPGSVQIDVVDIFRASDAVPPIVDEAIKRGGVKLVWMQEGVTHHAAAQKAEDAGIAVVMDACLAVIHAQNRA